MKIQCLAVLEHSFCNVYLPLRACGDIGRVVQAGTSVLTTAMEVASQIRATKLTNKSNESSVNATNEANKAIAEQNNLTELQIHEDDRNFNAEEAQKQREWDTAASQRQRLIDAGYNPLMIGNGVEGGGSSAASAPSAPSLNSAVLNPNHYDKPDFSMLTNLGQALGLFEQMEDIKGKQIENNFKPDQYASEIEYRKALIENVSHQTKQISENLKWLPKHNLMKWRIDRINEKIFKQQLKEMEETFEARKKATEWIPKIQEQQWRNFEDIHKKNLKEIELMDTQMLLMEAQRNKLIAETITIEELRPEQVAYLREQILNLRMRSALPVLDIPPMYRDSFFSCLQDLHFDTSGFQHLSGTMYYREPNQYVKAFLYAAGLLSGKIDINEALNQFGTTNTSSLSDDTKLPFETQLEEARKNALGQ